MVNEQTVEKLYTMRLGAMALAWQEQAGSASTAKLSFDDRFGMLVDAEHLARDNRRLKRLLKAAELRIPDACVEGVKASAKRGIERKLLHELGSLSWVGKKLNVLVTGKTGVGKSYLACALGQMACRRGVRTLYRRMPRLLDELALAKLEGNYRRVLAKLSKHDVLVIDDIGLGSSLRNSQHRQPRRPTTTRRPYATRPKRDHDPADQVITMLWIGRSRCVECARASGARATRARAVRKAGPQVPPS